MNHASPKCKKDQISLLLPPSHPPPGLLHNTAYCSSAFSSTKEPFEWCLKTLLQASAPARTYVYSTSFSISSSHLNILGSR